MRFKSSGAILILQLIFYVCAWNENVVEIEPQIDIVDAVGLSRIIGGSVGEIGAFPFLISLRTARNMQHFCGGFIVTERWIGSAAHCTRGKQPSNVVAVAGEISNSKAGRPIVLSKFVIHQKFDLKSLRNDISMIRTATPIKFSPNVKPVRLLADHVNDGIEAVVSGFGFTTYPGKASDILKYTKVRTISNRQCRSMMAKSSKANSSRVFDSSICTLPVKADDKTGTCLGDSGGALVTSTGLLLGITSWGVPCAVQGVPDVFTRVDFYHNWIDKTINS